MLQIFILLSRYLFLFYIGFFLLQGFLIALKEEDILPNVHIPFALSNQRVMIILFHITAFIILSFYETDSFINTTTLGIGIITLIFITLGNLITYNIYKGSSHTIWNGIFFLMDIGLVILLRLNPNLAQKQLVWYFIGYVIAMFLPIILALMPRLDYFKHLYIISAITLLISTLLFGVKEGGAVNWIKIHGIMFQPSEIVKLLFVFYLASALSAKPKFNQLIVPTVLSGIIVLCLVFQTDLGSALIFFMTFMVVIYIATSSNIIFISGMGLASLASIIAYRLFSHVRVRVTTWQNPWADISSGGYQITQSLFAIATWGIMGSGLTRGYSKNIPVVERDFIFAAICEEFGVLFAIGLILIFIMIFLGGAKIALQCKSRFLSLLSAGLTALLAFQGFLIIGGVTKFIPLTGVTLPFVSYGGTSIVMSFVTISILQWIACKNSKYPIPLVPEDIEERNPLPNDNIDKHPRSKKNTETKKSVHSSKYNKTNSTEDVPQRRRRQRR